MMNANTKSHDQLAPIRIPRTRKSVKLDSIDYSSGIDVLLRFKRDLRRFDSSRRSFAFRLGLLGLRAGGGGRSASASTFWKRSIAISRLAPCVRACDATM